MEDGLEHATPVATGWRVHDACEAAAMEAMEADYALPDYPPMTIDDVLEYQYGEQPRGYRSMRRNPYNFSSGGSEGYIKLVDQFKHVLATRASRFREFRKGNAIDERDLVMAILSSPDVMPRAFIDTPPRPGRLPRAPSPASQN